MGSSGNKRLALLAGAGRLPVLVAEAAVARGREVTVFGFEGMLDPALNAVAAAVHIMPFCRLSGLLAALEAEGLTQAVTIGSIAQTSLMTGTPQFDEFALQLWAKLADRRVDSIMLALLTELSRRGVEVLPVVDFLDGHLAPAGDLTKRKPTEKERAEIRFGFRMAKAIGGLDVGQTVVVKHRAVMAVEAVEGTDQAIRRGGALAKGGAIVVKVAKPGQDLRFDVPAVGRETLTAMREGGADVLAVEAGMVLLVERADLIAAADAAGICLVGVGEDADGA